LEHGAPGYEFAVADINADGGVYVEEYGVKVPLRLTYYDDESDPHRQSASSKPSSPNRM